MFRRPTKPSPSEDGPPLSHPPSHLSIMELPDGTTLRYGKGATVALPLEPRKNLEPTGEEHEGYFIHLGESQTRLPIPAPWPATASPVYVQDAHAEALRFMTFGSMPAQGTLATEYTEVMRLVLLSGSGAVGKTSLVRQLVESRFDDNYFSTPELLWREMSLSIVNRRIPVLLRIADSPPTPNLSYETELLTRSDCFMVLFSHEIAGSLDTAADVARVVKKMIQERSTSIRNRLASAMEAIDEVEGDDNVNSDKKAALHSLTSDETFGAPPMMLVASRIDSGHGPGPLIKSAEQVAEELGVDVASVSSKDGDSVRSAVERLIETAVWQKWRVKRAFEQATE